MPYFLQSSPNFADGLRGKIEVCGICRLEKLLDAGVCIFTLAGFADDIGIHQVHADDLPVPEIEVGVFTDIRHAGQYLGNRSALRALQNRSQNLTMLRFRASSVRCGQLFQRQGNIFVDIANYEIGSHSDPLVRNRRQYPIK